VGEGHTAIVCGNQLGQRKRIKISKKGNGKLGSHGMSEVQQIRT